jgi:tRNA (guanine-N7-)-methyltransferase
MYRAFLKSGGIVHLKTDSDLLCESTSDQIRINNYKIIQDTNDLYGALINDLDEDTQDILSIKTHYEALFSAKGFKIKYIKFTI